MTTSSYMLDNVKKSDTRTTNYRDRYKKKALLTVRMMPEDYADFATAAEIRGATMSGLIYMYAMRVIREEKERDSRAFDRKPPISGKTQTVAVLKEKAK